MQLSVIDCDKIEKQIIQSFKMKYFQRLDIGIEYFQGDVDTMIDDIFFISRDFKEKNTKKNEERIKKEKYEKEKDEDENENVNEKRIENENEKRIKKEESIKKEKYEEKEKDEDDNVIKIFNFDKYKHVS